MYQAIMHYIDMLTLRSKVRSSHCSCSHSETARSLGFRAGKEARAVRKSGGRTSDSCSCASAIRFFVANTIRSFLSFNCTFTFSAAGQASSAAASSTPVTSRTPSKGLVAPQYDPAPQMARCVERGESRSGSFYFFFLQAIDRRKKIMPGTL